MGIRVILVDDHEMIRAGIRSILEKEPGIEVIAEADNGRTAVERAKMLAPDVVMMDISMPDLNGIEATRQLLAECPETRVVALSGHNDARFVTDMMMAGAVAHVPKSSRSSEFGVAVCAAARGERYQGPKTPGLALDRSLRKKPVSARGVYGVLTVREREVLQLVAEGHSSKECAVRLDVCTKTIETHRNQIMCKLGIRSVAELTKYAIREGLTSLDV